MSKGSGSRNEEQAIIGKAIPHPARGGVYTGAGPKDVKAVMWKGKHLVSQIARDPTGKQGASVDVVNPFLEGKATTNTMDVHIEEIPPLRSPHPAHRHVVEAILIIIAGHGYSIIDGKRYDWEEGDIIALPSWVWHQHFNTDPKEPARFIAVKNGPLVKGLNLDEVEMKPWE